MIYTGILGTSYSNLTSIVLGSLTQNVQDIMDNTDLTNPVVVLTYKGEDWVARKLAGDPDLPTTLYVGWGTGTGTLSKANDTDVSLSRELFSEDTSAPRSLAVLSYEENWPQDGSGRTVSYVAKAVKTAVDDIMPSEAGLFDSAEGGNLLVQTTFDAIDLNGPTGLRAGDKIIFSFALDPS